MYASPREKRNDSLWRYGHTIAEPRVDLILSCISFSLSFLLILFIPIPIPISLSSHFPGQSFLHLRMIRFRGDAFFLFPCPIFNFVFGRMISISLYITLYDPGILGSISLHSNGVGFFGHFVIFFSLLG